MKHKIESANSEIIFLRTIRHDLQKEYIYRPDNESGDGQWYFPADIVDSICNRLTHRIKRLRDIMKHENNKD